MTDVKQIVEPIYLGAKSKYRSVKRHTAWPLIRFAEREAATMTEASLSLRERLSLWRRGFLSRESLTYDFDEYDPEEYLSSFQRQRAAFINEPFSAALDNKLLFYWLMAPFEDYRQDVHGLVRDGRFHDVSSSPAGKPRHLAASSDRVELGDGEGGLPDPNERIRDRLRAEGRLVLKPIANGGGKGISVLEHDGGSFLVDRERMSGPAFDEFVSTIENRLVCEYVEQASYAERVFPGSANTVRVVTMLDPEDEEPFIPAVRHRFGTTDSAPIDSGGDGGFSVSIDVETGRQVDGMQYHEGIMKEDDGHPDTGEPVEGLQIPGWEEIRSQILQMARTYSYLPYIGWDIVVTDEGDFTVIEANNCSGTRWLQTDEPLLTDSRVERFYRNHGVI